MHPWSPVHLLAAAADPTPQVTEIVRVRPGAHDPSWPPVLVASAAVVFLRRAWSAAHATRGPLDG
jgi:hypothetical protein